MDIDQIQGNEVLEPQAGEGQQLPEPMPSSDQKPTEEVQVAPDQSDDLRLPGDASERTRTQFEKLREENRRLKEQLKTPPPSYGNSVFDAFRAPEAPQPVQPLVDARGFDSLNQGQVDAITNQFIDQEGNVDVNGLNQALRDANDRARRAEQSVQNLSDQITKFEENQQAREAHAVHPELDPSNKNFDPKLFDLVRDRLLRNMYEGKKQTLLEAANDIKSVYTSPSPVNLDKVKEEAVTQYKQTQQQRQQGPIESGKGEPRSSTPVLQELREQSRKENPFTYSPALDERLRNAGIIRRSS